VNPANEHEAFGLTARKGWREAPGGDSGIIVRVAFARPAGRSAARVGWQDTSQYEELPAAPPLTGRGPAWRPRVPYWTDNDRGDTQPISAGTLAKPLGLPP
jgi:hypothetical protein